MKGLSFLCYIIILLHLHDWYWMFDFKDDWVAERPIKASKRRVLFILRGHQSWPYERHYAIIEIHDIDVHTNFTPFSLVAFVNLFSAVFFFFRSLSPFRPIFN